MKYYTFNQNNSGGKFHFDEERGIGHYVIIEAESIEAATKVAESKGIYFDGVSKGMDCGCCGDRWSLPYGDGDKKPLVYDENPQKIADKYNSLVFIHYANGKVKEVRRKVKGRKAKVLTLD